MLKGYKLVFTFSLLDSHLLKLIMEGAEGVLQHLPPERREDILLEHNILMWDLEQARA